MAAELVAESAEVMVAMTVVQMAVWKVDPSADYLARTEVDLWVADLVAH